MVTVSKTATLRGWAACAIEASVATLSNFISMLPLTATAIKTAKVKLAKRVVRFEDVNIFISPNWGHCGPLKRMYCRRMGIARAM